MGTRLAEYVSAARVDFAVPADAPCMARLSMNIELLKSMSDPDGIDDLPDEAAMTYAEFVAKLGKATDPHEHNKIEPAFVVIWHIVGRYLTGRNQVYWNQGRINDAKRVDTISALVIDTMRSFVSGSLSVRVAQLTPSSGEISSTGGPESRQIRVSTFRDLSGLRF